MLLAAVALLALVAALVLLLEGSSRPTGPAASAAKHPVARPQTQPKAQAPAQAPAPAPAQTPPTDAVSSAIAALATSLAGDGLPGDGALANALGATAGQPPGPDRQTSAQQVLSLARVLLDGGGITSGQYQSVVNVLQPAGATGSTTPPTTAAQAPGPFFQPHGHDHGHGQGDDGGG